MRNMQLAHIRDRSRSARECSNRLRVTSQQLRESLENLRAGAAAVNGAWPEHHRPWDGRAGGEQALPPRPTPLDFVFVRHWVYHSRLQAQALRRRAADLRSQAAQFCARSEDLCSNSAAI